MADEVNPNALNQSGRPVDDVVAELADEWGEHFAAARVDEARTVFEQVALADEFIEFLNEQQK